MENLSLWTDCPPRLRREPKSFLHVLEGAETAGATGHAAE